MTHSSCGTTADLASLAWERLSQAADSVNDPMRIMTMTTLDSAGLPQARLMILRGASRSDGRVWFHTDIDSRKTREIRRQPGICLLAYDAADGVQLRLLGRADLHTDDEIADDHWRQVLLMIDHAFGKPRTGARLPFTDPRLESIWLRLSRDGAASQRDRFTVIKVEVDAMEWHQMRGMDHFCISMRAGDNWQPRTLR